MTDPTAILTAAALLLALVVACVHAYRLSVRLDDAGEALESKERSHDAEVHAHTATRRELAEVRLEFAVACEENDELFAFWCKHEGVDLNVPDEWPEVLEQ